MLSAQLIAEYSVCTPVERYLFSDRMESGTKRTERNPGAAVPQENTIHKEVNIMSILGIVYYDRFDHNHQMPEWARSERYEYCDGFYEDHKDVKGGVLHSIASILMSVI